MGKYVFKRLLLIIPTLLMILLINFAIIQSAPGGPVEQQIAKIEQMSRGGAGQGSGLTHTSSNSFSSSLSGNQVNNQSRYQGSRGLSEKMIADIEKQYGFDKPAHQRFIMMVKNYARLDFGESFFKGQAVTTLIVEKLPVSVSLGIWSTLIIYLIAIPLGIYKATHHGSGLDKASAFLLAIGHSVPVFVFGVILLVVFSGGSYWQIFPLQGLVSDDFTELSWFAKIKDYFWHLALPLLASVVGGFASLTYLTKFSFMEELGKQYVITARAKGLNERQVMYGHVFRNAMLIIIAGMPSAIVGMFFAGNFMIEIIFNLDGLGLLGFEAIQQRDYPVIFGTMFIFTLLGLVLQLIGDIIYHLIDPRIDFEGV